MRTVWGALTLWGSVALAAPTTLTIATGDCRNPELISAAQSFALGVSEKAIASDAVLERFRPLPTVTAEDLGRQLDAAQAQFYAGTYDKALEATVQALAGIARLSPRAEPWKLRHRALMLQSMIHKSAGRKNESNEAQKRILRIEPQAKLDADYYTPATIQGFEALKKDVARAKKAKLTIASIPSGAQVFLDGAPVGKTPFAGDYPLGEYRLSLAAGDRLSFVRELKLSRDEAVQIDLGFEGAIAVQAPLCVADSSAAVDHALRLAALAGADSVTVLRLDARNNEPGFLTATLLEVNRSAKVREGGVRFTGPKRAQAVRDLAAFIHTGNPTAGIVATLGANAAEPTPKAEPVPKPEPAPGAGAEPAAVPPPPVAVAGSSAGHSWRPRIASFLLMGLGVAAAGTGVGLYAAGGGDRASLLSLIDEQGRLKPGASIADAKAVQGRVDGTNTVSLALGVSGGTGALIGLALFLLMPPSDAVAWGATGNGFYAAFAF